MNSMAIAFAAWTWIIPPTVATVGQVADGVTTYRATHGMTRVVCEEGNGLYQTTQPGVGRIVAMKATPVVAAWLVAVIAKRNPGSKALKIINAVTGVGVGISGFLPAVHNVTACGW